jgi:hypothetical protein
MLDFIPTGSPPMGRESNEQAAGFVAFALLPLIDVVILIGADLVETTNVSLMWFPLLFAALAAMACRLLAVNVGWGVLYTLGCGASCWLAAVTVGLIAAFTFPF